jgi:hypothetical protein
MLSTNAANWFPRRLSFGVVLLYVSKQRRPRVQEHDALFPQHVHDLVVDRGGEDPVHERELGVPKVVIRQRLEEASGGAILEMPSWAVVGPHNDRVLDHHDQV